MNLVTDVFPALALGVGAGSCGIMDEPPRPPDEPIIGPRHWRAILGYGALVTVATLAAFAIALGPLGLVADEAVTVSFLTLAIGQTVHVFNMRSRSSRWLVNEVTSNRWVWGAVALSLGLCVAVVYIPPLGAVLSLSPPSATAWAVIGAFGIVPLIVGQLIHTAVKWLVRPSAE